MTLADAATVHEIQTRLSRLTADTPRVWGKMTAHQMMCHLSDSFHVAMNERPAGSVANAFTRGVMKWIALRAPLKWPKDLPTMREVNQQIDGTKPIGFDRDFAELRRTIDRFVARPRDFEWGVHPLFGRMSEDEWLRWGYLHADHHLRQFGI